MITNDFIKTTVRYKINELFKNRTDFNDTKNTENSKLALEIINVIKNNINDFFEDKDVYYKKEKSAKTT